MFHGECFTSVQGIKVSFSQNNFYQTIYLHFVSVIMLVRSKKIKLANILWGSLYG